MGDILVVGSASVEQLHVLSEELQEGRKQTARLCVPAVGGSGVNYACRLLAMGRSVSVLLAMGDDEGGGRIRAALEESARRGRIPAGLDLTVCRLDRTPITTIVIEPGGRRTIIDEPVKIPSDFASRARDWLARTMAKASAGDALMVGHLPGDQGGSVTGELIEEFRRRRKHGFILLNPGRSQYEPGIGGFARELPKVDCLQLADHEALAFAPKIGKGSAKELTYAEALKRLSDSGACRAAVITFARLGAVGREQEGDGGVLAYPYRLHSQCKDETGAGDAFAAGLVFSLTSARPGTLHHAMDVARLWASYACTQYGGAGACPSWEELHQWAKTYEADAVAEVTEMLAGQLDALLGLYDQALS